MRPKPQPDLVARDARELERDREKAREWVAEAMQDAADRAEAAAERIERAVEWIPCPVCGVTGGFHDGMKHGEAGR